jgi:Na+/proline symporter
VTGWRWPFFLACAVSVGAVSVGLGALGAAGGSTGAVTGVTISAVAAGVSLTEKTALMLVLVGVAQYIAGQLDQDTVQRWCSAKSAREARKSMIVLGLGALPIWTTFMFLGTCLWVYFQHFPSEVATAVLGGTRKAEDILPHFIVTVLPPGLAGLVVSAALAAAMGSLSGSINSSGMVWVNDIYRLYLARDGMPSTPIACSPQAALNLVEHQQKPALIANRAKVLEKIRTRNMNSPLALDRLDKDRDRIFIHCGADGIEITKRQMAEPL